MYIFVEFCKLFHISMQLRFITNYFMGIFISYVYKSRNFSFDKSALLQLIIKIKFLTKFSDLLRTVDSLFEKELPLKCQKIACNKYNVRRYSQNKIHTAKAIKLLFLSHDINGVFPVKYYENA